MKKLLLSSVAFCALGLLAADPAKAVVVSTTLGIHPSSNISLVLDALGGSTTGGVNVGVSGSLDITADNVGVDALALSIDSGSLLLDDGSLGLSLGPLGGVLADLIGIGVSVASGPLTHVSSSGGVNIFDAGGATLSLDSGMITYEATGYAGTLLPPGTFDFASSPLSLVVTPGNTIKLLETPKDATTNNVSLVIPISVVQSIATSPVDINATLDVLIIATGMKLTDNGPPVIPEPSSWLLIGLGLMSVVPMIRRRLRR